MSYSHLLNFNNLNMTKLWKIVFALWLFAAPSYGAGTIMIAGGGSEGDIGDTTSWSYRLYPHLLDGGDINGDGRITVAVIADSSQSNFIPQYFKWLGADDAFNVVVVSRNQANDPNVVDAVRGADAIFIKGGDQGEYYDLWNGTRLEDNIRYVVNLNGGVGGTSAGAMSVSQYAFAGGQDYISLDVLQNAQTQYLNDTDGGSGIHTDFLGFLPNTVVDSHFADRGRLPRLMGIMAKASQDNANPNILGIGISDQTGLWIKDTSASVIGVGSVSFLRQTPQTVVKRPSGAPLYMTNVQADVLTEGWSFNLSSRTVASQPADAQVVNYAGNSPSNLNSLTIRGNNKSDEKYFAFKTTYGTQGYSLIPTTSSTYIFNSIGTVDSQNSTYRGAIQETLLRGLYDYPSYSGLMVSVGGNITRSSSNPNALSFGATNRLTPEAASVVIDGKLMSAKSLSPYISVSDSGNGSLRAAALTNLRVHILGQTSTWGTTYNSQTHAIQP
jgi:cyanophycinase